MKTINRYLCIECAQMLRDANLVYKKVAGCEGMEPECQWCNKKRYGAVYRIKYGGKNGKES